MMLSPHFSDTELGVQSGSGATPQQVANAQQLCTLLLEPIRAQYGPIAVDDGYRTPEHNAAEAGLPRASICTWARTARRIFGLWGNCWRPSSTGSGWKVIYPSIKSSWSVTPARRRRSASTSATTEHWRNSAEWRSRVRLTGPGLIRLWCSIHRKGGSPERERQGPSVTGGAFGLCGWVRALEWQTQRCVRQELARRVS